MKPLDLIHSNREDDIKIAQKIYKKLKEMNSITLEFHSKFYEKYGRVLANWKARNHISLS